MAKNVLNGDTKTEAAPAVFTRPLALMWPPKSFILSSLLPPYFPRFFTAAGFLTRNLNTSHSNILFIFLAKLSELTFDFSTVDLDFAIVCVSVHF